MELSLTDIERLGTALKKKKKWDLGFECVKSEMPFIHLRRDTK